jgi:hypothetical protein
MEGHEKLGGKPPGKTFRTLAREQFEEALTNCKMPEVVGKILYLLQNAKDERLQFDCAKLIKEWNIGTDPVAMQIVLDVDRQRGLIE